LDGFKVTNAMLSQPTDPLPLSCEDPHLQFASFFGEAALRPYAYLVSSLLAEGHICVDLSRTGQLMAKLPEPLRAAFVPGNTVLQQSAFVSTRPEQPQPFIWHNGRLYLQRYFHYETQILERIGLFTEQERTEQDARRQLLLALKDYVQELFPEDPKVPGPDWQLLAALQSFCLQFVLVTGGPGTGKTTTVARILALLYRQNPGLRIALAAPTGKAAARMAESLKNSGKTLGSVSDLFARLAPSTLHRLLQGMPDSPQFRYNEANPLPYDVVIVDEASMIDVALMAKLMNAIGPTTRLLLLGDKDQLASVEAGSILGDVCVAAGVINRFDNDTQSFLNTFIGNPDRQLGADSLAPGTEHPLAGRIVRLTYSRRFRDTQGIGRFSKAVLQGEMQEAATFATASGDNSVIITDGYDDAAFEAFAEGYKAYIGEPDPRKALELLNKQRLLCAVREGSQGLYQLNRRIERYLEERKLIRFTGEFYEHRPLIVTRNYYNLGLFNGDVGIVRKDDRGQLRVFFEDSKGELRSVLPGYLAQVETVFAMTIHKSQGSEFDRVLVLLPENASPLLTRELLYTGVTRARHQVAIQAPLAVLQHCIERTVERGSGIAGRLATWKYVRPEHQNQ